MRCPLAEPRILLWDIETSHNLAAIFTLKNQDYIQADNIIQERYVICAAWKWLDAPKVSAVSVLDNPKLYAKSPHNDFHVVQALHAVLSEADVIVAHNGDAYDIKFTEARMLLQGLPPLPPITKIDTLKAARDRFLFNANNLNYLGQVLGCGKKKPTKPGLWLKVLAGDKQAIRDMVAYNKQDVLLLEKVFLKLRPYMANHVNRQLYGESGCPRCGSRRVQSRGFHRALTQVYRKFCCVDCKGWYRERKAMKGTETRILG